jgi:hypothetical protein
MSSDIEKRLAAIERRLNAMGPASPGGFRILIVEGLLPGEPRWAYASEHKWKRETNESLDAFVERAARAAKGLAQTSLIVGGLPRASDEMAEYADFDAWWNAVAPNYSDVPDEEASGFARRRPLGAD